MPNTTEATRYGVDHRSKARAYAEGEVAAQLRRAIPVFSPGVPLAAWLGVAVNGGVRENTTGWLTGDVAERANAGNSRRLPLGGSYEPGDAHAWSNRGFHEVGVFGVEAGPAQGLVPGRGAHDSWLKLALDDESQGYAVERRKIREVLGRNAVTSPGSWVAVADQVVLGVANNCRCARMVRAKLPEGLRWQVDREGYPVRWTQWVFGAGTMGWSAGIDGAAHHLSLNADDTARVSEAERWAAWCAALVQRTATTRAPSHENPFYSGNRTAQKFEAGVVASEFTREPEAAGFLRGFSTEAERVRVYDALAVGAGGRAAGGESGGSSSSGSSNGSPRSPIWRALAWVGGLVLVVGTGGYWWISRAAAKRLGIPEGRS